MDFLPDHETLSLWLINYGSFALFFLLVLGIVALPVPEETLLVISGALMSQGSINIPETIIAAYAGSICGITTSYYLGKVTNNYVLIKYGKWIGLGEKQIDLAHKWFERFGKWTLTIGYFIPGVRHLTGFLAGMTQLAFKDFAIYAYSGGIIWVSTFLSLGYFFGHHWNHVYEYFESFEATDTLLCGVVALLVVFGIFWFRRKQKRKEEV